MEKDTRQIPFYAARLIIRFLQKNLSLTEKEELDQWICFSEENLQLFNELTGQ